MAGKISDEEPCPVMGKTHSGKNRTSTVAMERDYTFSKPHTNAKLDCDFVARIPRKHILKSKYSFCTSPAVVVADAAAVMLVVVEATAVVVVVEVMVKAVVMVAGVMHVAVVVAAAVVVVVLAAVRGSSSTSKSENHKAMTS